MIKAKNLGFRNINCKNGRMIKVKYHELEVSKNKCKNGRMGKVKCQEMEVSKNHLQEWEDDKS